MHYKWNMFHWTLYYIFSLYYKQHHEDNYWNLIRVITVINYQSTFFVQSLNHVLEIINLFKLVIAPWIYSEIMTVNHIHEALKLINNLTIFYKTWLSDNNTIIILWIWLTFVRKTRWILILYLNPNILRVSLTLLISTKELDIYVFLF